MATLNPPKCVSKDMKQLDQSMVEIVNGINGLLINARLHRLRTISSILEDARESIAWWAVHDNYDESHAEKVAHDMNFSSAMYMAMTLLAKFNALKDEHLRQELLEFMGYH